MCCRRLATQMDCPAANKILNRDDPFEAIDGLTTEMFDIITAGRTAALSSLEMVRKREMPRQERILQPESERELVDAERASETDSE